MSDGEVSRRARTNCNQQCISPVCCCGCVAVWPCGCVLCGCVVHVCASHRLSHVRRYAVNLSCAYNNTTTLTNSLSDSLLSAPVSTVSPVAV